MRQRPAKVWGDEQELCMIEHMNADSHEPDFKIALQS